MESNMLQPECQTSAEPCRLLPETVSQWNATPVWVEVMLWSSSQRGRSKRNSTARWGKGHLMGSAARRTWKWLPSQGCEWHQFDRWVPAACSWASDSCSWEEAQRQCSWETGSVKVLVYGVKFGIPLALPGRHVQPLQFVIYSANCWTFLHLVVDFWK